MPAQNRVGRDDRRDLTEAPTASPMPVNGQPTAFLIGQAYPAAQVRAEDAVFFDQVGHGVLLPPVEPADQRAEQQAERHRVGHGARVYTTDPISGPKPVGRAMRQYALDFMTETLYDARRVRLLTVIDEGNREGLELAMGLSVPSRRVTRTLDELVAVHGCPSAIRVDNGPEFTAQSFVDWCTEHGVAIHYIQPGKPDQNAYIERFNRSYRTEVLNAHLFESVAELRAHTDTWLRTHNSERPHDSLGRVPPLMFLPRPSSAGQSLLAVST